MIRGENFIKLFMLLLLIFLFSPNYASQSKFPVRANLFQNLKKAHSPIEVSLKEISRDTANDKMEVVLEGQIYSLLPLNLVHIKWSSTTPVEFLSSTDFTLTNVKSKKEERFQIRIRGPIDENLQVILQAWSEKGKSKFGNVAKYNSKPPLLEKGSDTQTQEQKKKAPVKIIQ